MGKNSLYGNTVSSKTSSDKTKHSMSICRLCFAIYICVCKQIHGWHACNVVTHARAHVQPFNTFLSIAMHRPTVHVCTCVAPYARNGISRRWIDFSSKGALATTGRLYAPAYQYMIDYPLFIAMYFFSLLTVRGIKLHLQSIATIAMFIKHILQRKK